MIPKFRIPFHVKVLLSYFAVVAAGAIPALLYLQVSFYDQLIEDRAQEVARRGTLLAEQLRPLSDTLRVERVKTHARVEPVRMTYISKTGVVLFDSLGSSLTLENHATRPEVMRALGKLNDNPFDVGLTGVGVAHRVSETTGEEHLYVAVRIDEGARSDVIRFAYPMTRIEQLIGGMRDAIRNSQAAALTVAIMLSLLAAYVFGRPLKRLLRAANQLAGGDLTTAETWSSHDEIGDIGRALNRLALDIRTRLANADSGLTLLEQLVEDIDAPLAVLSASDAIAVNASFRKVVEHDRRDAEEVLATILRAPAYAKARSDAEAHADGVAFDFSAERFDVPMRLFSLKQASHESLSVLVCRVPDGFLTHWHPNANDVTPLNVLECAADAIRRCEAVFPEIVIALETPTGPIHAADVDRRLDTALDFAIDAAADEQPGGFTVEIRQSETTVTITLWVGLSAWIGKLAGSLVSPLGGVVTDEGHSLVFIVPRA